MIDLKILELSYAIDIEAEPGKPFEVHETGWGEFEIQIKFHFVNESGEKPASFWHQLRLHHYGDEETQAEQRASGTIKAWQYDEILFNEPYQPLFDILTGGAGEKKNQPPKNAANARLRQDLRTATIPLKGSPDQPYSKETEKLQLEQLNEANNEVQKLLAAKTAELSTQDARIAELKAKLGTRWMSQENSARDNLII